MFDKLKNATLEALQQALEDSAKKAIKKTGVTVDDLKISADENATVTVRGKVDSEDDKKKIVKAVKGIKGLKKIRHGIKVQDKDASEGEEDGSGDDREDVVYVVRPGDSMWGIAEKFYGDGSVWKEKIYEANKELIGDKPDLIHPGYELVIPQD